MHTFMVTFAMRRENSQIKKGQLDSLYSHRWHVFLEKSPGISRACHVSEQRGLYHVSFNRRQTFNDFLGGSQLRFTCWILLVNSFSGSPVVQGTGHTRSLLERCVLASGRQGGCCWYQLVICLVPSRRFKRFQVFPEFQPCNVSLVILVVRDCWPGYISCVSNIACPGTQHFTSQVAVCQGRPSK